MLLGIDITEIGRIEKSLQIPGFLDRVYSAEEKEELRRRNFPVQSVASAFAAKEAFSKAIGTGIRGFSLNEISLLHNELGAPYLKFSGRAVEIASKTGCDFTVSITHTDDYAVAVVAAYSKDSSSV